jgi:hypothetical protein
MSTATTWFYEAILILSKDAEMAILIQLLQTNVHLPVADFIMALLGSDFRGATSSRTRAIAWPATPTAGTVWAPPTLSVSLVATRTTIC